MFLYNRKLLHPLKLQSQKIRRKLEHEQLQFNGTNK